MYGLVCSRTSCSLTWKQIAFDVLLFSLTWHSFLKKIKIKLTTIAFTQQEYDIHILLRVSLSSLLSYQPGILLGWVDKAMHLAKWMAPLGQVTLMHLAKCPHQLTTWSSAIQIYNFPERHLAKWHIVALSQVITQTGYFPKTESGSKSNFILSNG